MQILTELYTCWLTHKDIETIITTICCICSEKFKKKKIDQIKESEKILQNSIKLLETESESLKFKKTKMPGMDKTANLASSH